MDYTKAKAVATLYERVNYHASAIRASEHTVDVEIIDRSFRSVVSALREVLLELDKPLE